MTPGRIIALALILGVILWALIEDGPAAAFAVALLSAAGIFIWGCLQDLVRGVLRLSDRSPGVEYHYHVYPSQMAAHRDPTAAEPNWDDIEMHLVDGVWRKR
jgi:hypothetical protein